MAEMGQVRGVEDLGLFHLIGQPNLNIRVDRAKAARYGLNSGDVTTFIQTALAGNTATTVLEGDRQFAVVVRIAQEYRQSIDEIKSIKVGFSTPSGTTAYVPLSELATISLDTDASFIYRELSQRYAPIKFSVRGRDLGSTVAEAQDRIKATVQLPTGYRIIWAGEFQDLQEAKTRLMVVVPITFLLILALLYGLFSSFRESLVSRSQ
jgi:cobalt-zinc-cadmium resistance protein CzcA